MAWLPFEDKIAGESENLILKYNPDWSGNGETRKPIAIPDAFNRFFDLTYHEEYDINIPFTRESRHVRMRSCRGVGASLDENQLKNWDNEHKVLLEKIAPEKFDVLHYAAIAELKLK